VHNVAIELRSADDRYERLPGLAAELVDRRVAVIFAGGGNVSAVVAKAAMHPLRHNMSARCRM
jgi:putative ABC transport system substrate-binding protein